MCTIHKDQCSFMIISSYVHLRRRNISDKLCRENQNTYFVSNNFFFFENRAVYDIGSKGKDKVPLLQAYVA